MAEEKILIIDDDMVIREILKISLVQEGYSVIESSDGQDALDRLSNEMPDLIVLDLMLPKIDGYRVCQHIKNDSKLCKIPIIMLTAKVALEDKIRGFEMGADDYITKPFAYKELSARVKALLRRKDIAVELSPLTNLPGNSAVMERIEQLVTTNKLFAICYLDLNRFKVYNDKYGFSQGDQVINMTGQIISNAVIEYGTGDDFVGHIGGDDFVIITSPDVSDAIGDNIIKMFDEKILSYYTPDDRNRQYVLSVDRQGGIQRFPIMSISIVVITNEKKKITHRAEIEQLASELHEYVKSFESSKQIKDRRQEIGKIISIGGAVGEEELLWEEVTTVRAEQGGTKDLLFDRITGLPTVPLVMGEVKKFLHGSKQAGILYLNIVKYNRREGIYDWQIFDKIIREAVTYLRESKGHILRKEDVLAADTEQKHEGQVIFLSPPRDKDSSVPKETLDKISQRIKDNLHTHLGKSLGEHIIQRFGIYIGYSLLTYEPEFSAEQVVSRALKDALQVASKQERRDYSYRTNKLKEIVLNEDIYPVFQPIVELKSLEVIGYEALIRGPRGSVLEFPESLFSLARELDLVIELDCLCREKALAHAPGLKPNQRMFLNVEPEVIDNLKFRNMNWVNKNLIKIEDIVLEISGQLAVRDFNLFRYIMEVFKMQGFKIAIDDVESSEYTVLSSLGRMKPDFVKVNISFIGDIDKDPIKQRLLTTLLDFSNRMGAKVITEGIETIDEYKILLKLGAHYGQGFLFACPLTPEQVADSSQVINLIDKIS